MLAKRLCQWYSLPWDEQKEQMLQDLENSCIDVNPMDFTIKKVSTLSRDTSINYGDVNIGKGWRP